MTPDELERRTERFAAAGKFDIRGQAAAFGRVLRARRSDQLKDEPATAAKRNTFWSCCHFERTTVRSAAIMLETNVLGKLLSFNTLAACTLVRFARFRGE